SEERLGLALAGTDLGLWDEWISTGELHVNNRWAEILGYTLEEISPVSMNFWRENTHPDDLKEVDKIGLKYPRKENDIINHDIRMKHKNGSWVWIRTKGKVSEWSDNGEPLRSSGTHLDITEQKNIEIKLKKSEEKYRSYFDNSPLSLWEEDFTEVMAYLNGLSVTGVEDIRNYLDIHPEEVKKCVEMVKILDVNPATLRLYDAQSKEDLYWNLDNVFTESAYEFFKDELICLYKNERFFSAETIGRTLTGRTIEIKLEMAVLYDNRVLVTIMDITELKSKETELMELLKQTKADTETKEILLREIIHRVKNNLSAFIGMLYAEKRQSDHKMEDTQLVLIDSMI
ncbi:MAG: PAS domain-containing protein, partial [Spirochaetales bacterium]|nr:PAS domain-containing protein [Spirochaetales bacterium]